MPAFERERRRMLSDSLDHLIRCLLPAATPESRMVRLTPVAAAEAQEACRCGGSSVGDKAIERLLEHAGVSLKRRGAPSQPRLVWARLEQADTGKDGTGIPPPRLALYRVELADWRPPQENQEWLVKAHCWRRGPDGSIAVYEISPQKPFVRVFETEVETIDDRTAAAVTASMIQQLVTELSPLIMRAVLATQGVDPDRRPGRDRLS
jgi:hypothetical protein